MPSLHRKAFRLEPVNESHAEHVFNLCATAGGRNLTACSRVEVKKWCRRHQGIVALEDDSGEIAGACFFEEKQLPVAGGARSVYGDLTFLYMHHQVVAPQYRSLGLGRRIGEATIALAFATLDGPFPSCVACTFLDSPSSLRSQRRAGMLVVPQWDASVIDSFPVLRALDSHAWTTKLRIGTERPHALEAFRDDQLPRIARWLTVAFAFPFRDPTHDITIRVADGSKGRSNFRRSMRALACNEAAAIARLNRNIPHPRCA